MADYDQQPESESAEAEGEDDRREDYFASLFGISPDRGALSARVENTGRAAIPAGWIHVQGTLVGPDGSVVADLEWQSNEQDVTPGDSIGVGRWAPSVADGAYWATSRMLIIDDRGIEHCADTADSTEVDVEASSFDYHHTDDISTPELGDELAAAGAFAIAFDPFPYIADGELVVSLHNTGSMTVPMYSPVEVTLRMEPVATPALDRELLPDDRWSVTVALPADQETGNHYTGVNVDLGSGNRAHVGFDTVVQDGRVVDVLMQ
jgi:hypothetical protein